MIIKSVLGLVCLIAVAFSINYSGQPSRGESSPVMPVPSSTPRVPGIEVVLPSYVDPTRVGLVSPRSPGVGAFRQVRAVGSDWCLGYRPADLARESYLATSRCNVSNRGSNTDGFSSLIVVPHPRGGFTLRSPNPWGARDLGSRNSQNRLLSCVTVARNVVIGPPGIDILPCEAGEGGSWDDAGAADQVFYFVEVPAATRGSANQFPDPNFFIQSAIRDENSGRFRCLDVRGASSDLNTDLILWDCNNQANQMFHFEGSSAVNSSSEMNLSRRLSYVRSNSDTKGIGLLWRAVPVAGYDLPGMDLDEGGVRGFDTEDDNGAACARECVTTSQCRAFTWVKPGVQGERAKCYLKSGYNRAVTNPNTASGVVRASGRLY